MSNRAWVTLATNDSYGLGALVLAHSLRRVGSANPAAILITPAVTEAMRNRLSAVFAEVISVDVLDSKDEAHLALLQRPELGITFTKIHCWGLTQYEKCVFMDADTLVVQNCDELFDREEFSAAPDVGWPDCFNSGVFVFKPSKETFGKLIKFAQERGSFDGGDQGLLNSFFSDWAHGDINKHLPFLYNVTSAAFYSYIPALKQYGQNLKIIHFIGAAKPWLQQYNWDSHSVDAPEHLKEFLQLWWDIFEGQVHRQLDVTMVTENEEPGSEMEDSPEFEPQNTAYYAPDVNPESEFAWHHPDKEYKDKESYENKLDLTQLYDPWEHHRGDIPGSIDAFSYKEIEVEHKNFIPLHEESQYRNSSQPNDITRCSEQYQSDDIQQWHDSSNQNSHSDDLQKSERCTPPHTIFDQDSKKMHSQTQLEHSHNDPYSQHNNLNHFVSKHQSYDFNTHYQSTYDQLPIKSIHQNVVQVYHVHMDHKKSRKHHLHKSSDNPTTNGNISDTESEDYDDFIPRHPYDGFYLRHRATINPRGHKICTHEVPLAPSPSPSPLDFTLLIDTKELENGVLIDNINDDYCTHTGVAGNLAKVVPGASSSQREALDELGRRQGWEAGNIDYMGADSFDNIWAKISQTLGEPKSSLPEQVKEPTPPIKEPTPPPKEPSPPPKEPTPLPKEPTPPPKEPTPTPKENKPLPKEPTPPLKEPTPPSKEPSVPKESPIEEPKPLETEAPVLKAVEEASIPAPVVEAFAEILKEATLEFAPAVPPTPPATPKSTTEPSTPVSETVPQFVASTEESEAKVALSAEAPVVAPKVEEASVEVAVVESSVDAPKIADTPVEVVDTPIEVPKALDATVGLTEAAVVHVEVPKEEAPVSATESPATDITSVKPAETVPSQSDSPPLANTPSTESPVVPATKSEEKRKPASKLLLPSAGVGDALPTPDSEFEDAATLAQSIIASELATPTVSSPSPISTVPPSLPIQPEQLAPAEPDVPTPPIGASVSLAQIGVKPSKVSCAEQIVSSITDQGEESAKPTGGPVSEPTTPTGAPKKKVVKKVAKKEGDAPVPPPRKKEKKPKDK